MSLFDLTDFERLGNIERDIHFTSLEETIELVQQLSSCALRSVQIYTPDLEPAIYNNQSFIDNLLAMSRGNRQARIQILAMDSSMAVTRGHMLLGLAHKLTSVIEIRRPSEEYASDNMAFMLVDGKGFIYRPDTSDYSGIYTPECRVRAQKLEQIFSQIWDHSDLDINTRRLNL